MRSRKSPIWFYFILILFPFLLLGILEIGLGIFEYGKNLDTWTTAEKNRIMLNPEISARYFNNIEDYPHSNNDTFLEKKNEKTFRIFVLGGSTAAGFPYSPNGSFPHFLQDYLELNFPTKNFEIINLGITAINSFAILDLIPDVVQQNPDLVLIYAGHNEFYGALGTASSDRIINSQFFTKLYLNLNKYKIFQLVKDFSKWTISIFSKEEKMQNNQTLMSRMAREQKIEFDSDVYNKGIDQFKNNLNEILEYTSLSNIPVLIGTLVSNIKDQKPFISTDYNGTSAIQLFSQGNNLLENDYKKADSLLQLAKELDGLRFRAPNKFNFIIKDIAKKYNSTIVDIKNKFQTESSNRIVGNSLMVDHLHPNLEGYQLMGKAFYEAIEKNNFIEKSSIENIIIANQDSLVKNNFAFTKLDSLSSSYRVKNLFNNWPFKSDNKIRIPAIPKNNIAKLAYNIVYKKLNWRKAHQEAYRYYLGKNDFYNFSREIKVLLSQYPYKHDYYNFAAQKLLEAKQYKLARDFLYKKNKIAPDGFSNKWLGNIALTMRDYDNAIKYYTTSMTYSKNDPQTLYNLGMAYYRKSDIESAKKHLELNLKINPKHILSKNLLEKLN